MDKFLTDMHVNWFTPVILTYIGNSCFLVNVFMPTGFEVPHVSMCGSIISELNKLSLSKILDVTKDSATWNERIIASHRAMAISRMNLYSYLRNPLTVKIEPQHIAADSIYVVRILF